MLVAHRGTPGEGTKRPSPGGWVKRTALCALLSVGALMGTAQSAHAHAELVDVVPAQNAILPTAPSVLMLRFSENVALHPDGVRVRDDKGGELEIGEPIVVRNTVQVPFPPSAAQGWYALEWSIISEDGHAVRGETVFGVGSPDLAARARLDAGASPSSTDQGRTPVRGVADLVTLCALGSLVGARLVRSRRAEKFVRVAAWCAAGCTAVWAGTQINTLGGVASWWQNAPGLPFLFRTGGLLLLAVTAGRQLPLSAAGAVAVLGSYSFVGHVRVLDWPVNAALLGVHLTAASLWLGAAPVLLMHLFDRVCEQEQRDAVRRFSALATAAMPIAVLAGTALAYRFDALDASGAYLKILLGKLSLVAGAIAIGAAARMAIRRIADTFPRRALLVGLGIDTGLLVSISVLSAMLATTSPPALASEPKETRSGETKLCMASVGGEMFHVELSPGLVGSNTAVVSAVTTASQQPPSVSLLLSEGASAAAIKHQLRLNPDQNWVGSIVVPRPGRWSATVVVTPDRFTVAEGSCEIQLW